MKVGVFWRKFRNVEFQKKVSHHSIYDDAYDEAFQHLTAIKKAGFNATLIEWRKDPIEVYKEILSEDIDIVFNVSSLTEIAFLEAFGIPFIGSGIDLVATNKVVRKNIVAHHDVPTPKFIVVRNPSHIPEHDLQYPLFVKPDRGRGSCGISEENLVYRPEDLPRVISKITDKIGQDALVEEYIKGREITVGIIGNDDPVVLPLMEVEYSSSKTNTFEEKMLGNAIIHCPATGLTKAEEQNIRDVAKRAYLALNAKDFGRVDVMFSDEGTPYFLELNTFAGLTMTGDAHRGYMGYMAEAQGMTDAEFIGYIVRSGIERYQSKAVEEVS